MTVQVVPRTAQVAPPGEAVTVYPVIGVPPLVADAVHATTDWVLAYEVAVTPVGTEGTVAGVAGPEAAEAGPVPAPLVAFTVNV